MGYAESFSFEKLLSFPYELKGIFHGFNIYEVKEKLDKNSLTILNISREKPEESLGFLIIYPEEKLKYKATAKIPPEVRESPLENKSFIASLIQNFFDKRIENFYFREKFRSKLNFFKKKLQSFKMI
ncbi:MAG: hypothetical protein ACP5O8_02695 [Candidatus Aenigmatarchaeota archaeon]